MSTPQKPINLTAAPEILDPDYEMTVINPILRLSRELREKGKSGFLPCQITLSVEDAPRECGLPYARSIRLQFHQEEDDYNGWNFTFEELANLSSLATVTIPTDALLNSNCGPHGIIEAVLVRTAILNVDFNKMESLTFTLTVGATSIHQNFLVSEIPENILDY